MSRPDLFSTPPCPETNLLPYDGTVNDYGTILSRQSADAWLETLLRDIPWRHDEVVICGRRITTARKVAWYGDGAFRYAYSGVARTALPWDAAVFSLKEIVEQRLAAVSPALFNSCLLNLYSDGREGMAWHSDNETELGKRTVIASLSLGAARKFAFKHKRTGEKREIMLRHGQLIVMRGETQQYWLHALMKSTRVTEPRINLTFRTFLAK